MGTNGPVAFRDAKAQGTEGLTRCALERRLRVSPAQSSQLFSAPSKSRHPPPGFVRLLFVYMGSSLSVRVSSADAVNESV